jgi:hypothetical protein
LYVIAILGIEITLLAEHKGDLVRECLVVVRGDDVYVARRSECTDRGVRKHGKNRGGADDVKLPDSKALAYLKNDVVQLSAEYDADL